MSKVLVIVRHGKSTWDYSGIHDMDRPLKEAGILNTLSVAGKLTDKKVHPDLIITSPANRAFHTATLVARATGYKVENLNVNEILYSENEDRILHLIYETNNNVNTLVIVGHNPTFTDLSNYFLRNKISNLPTSGTTVLTFDCNDWNKISPSNCVSEMCFFPKTLNND